MVHARTMKLDRAIDNDRDHVLGDTDAPMTLVEYGSYACRHCRAAHEVIADLGDRFGDRIRYVFRHRPISGSKEAEGAAELAEYVSATTSDFWTIHDALMKHRATFSDADFERIASDFDLPPRDERDIGPSPQARPCGGAAQFTATEKRARRSSLGTDHGVPLEVGGQIESVNKIPLEVFFHFFGEPPSLLRHR